MTIYLQNDFESKWPLWLTNGCHGRIEIGAGEISSELCENIRQWSAFFREHYSYEAGWDSPDHERTHRIRGQRLLLLLRAELSDDQVELRLWECQAANLEE